MTWAGLDWVQYYMFRVLCVGAFVHVLVFGVGFYGYGYVAGRVAALVVGHPAVRRRIRNLDYYTFMSP